MNSFYMPTRVYAEDEAVRRHAGELASLGRKALIVTGRRSAFENGVYEDIRQALEGKGTGSVLFSETEENPSVETVMKARDFGLSEGVDFVIGAGGGSALDAAKAVALMIRNAGRGPEFLYEKTPGAQALPVAAVPTTCGTGSEVTGVSVLTNTEKGVKKSIPAKIFPELALIDGKYLRTASFSVLACTAFDALTHMIESDLNSSATAMSRMCTAAGLERWALSQSVLRKEKQPDDRDFRNMMLASAMGGMAIAQTATSLPHGLSYPVTVRLGVPHGKACAYFTAGYLSEAPEEIRARLLGAAGFSSIRDFREVFYASCGPLGVSGEALREVLEATAEETAANPVKLALAPFPVDRERLWRIAFYEMEHPMGEGV